MIRKTDDAQMLVLEAVLFSVMVIMALVFVYQLSPSQHITVEKYTNQLQILGEDALRSLDNTNSENIMLYYNSRLVQYIATNDTKNFTQLLDILLPGFVGYKIYLGNGTETIRWYNGETMYPKVGLVSEARYIVVIPEFFLFYSENDVILSYWDNGAILPGYTGCVYEIILEMWSI